MIRTAFLMLGIAILLYAVFFIVAILYRLVLVRDISRASTPFSLQNEDAHARILVIGDSTGAGTGATSSLESVAGRLAHNLGSVSVVNLSQNGAKIHEVYEQLQSIKEAHVKYDLVLIQAGGNDILRFTSSDTLREDTSVMLTEAKKYSQHVIFMSTGNVGLAPLFMWPLSFVYDKRTRSAREIFMQVAQEQAVLYVDLFREKSEEPFSRDPGRYYSQDGLHPSGDGYAIWYEELKKKLPSFP